MTFKIDEVGFENWLIQQKQLGKKSAGDVVSRLKRSIKIVPYDKELSHAAYERDLINVMESLSVPLSSRASMLRSVRLYFEFRK